MKPRYPLLIISIFVFAVGAYLYLSFRIPDGVTPKSGGDTEATIATIGLISSIVAAITAGLSLLKSLVELRKAKSKAGG